MELFVETQVYWLANVLMLVMVLSFCYLNSHPAHYGRYTSNRSFGLVINPRVAWFVQECPSFFVPVTLLLHEWKQIRPVNLVLLGFFIMHYWYRVFLYPWKLSTNRSVPFSIVLAAFCFTSINGYLQAMDLCHVMQYDSSYVVRFPFVLGMIMACTGWSVNWHSDRILTGLKRSSPVDQQRYVIPQGGLFAYVSCANYFGECLEWIGWAIATQSRGGLCFAVCTCCNLVPRALTHHAWYHQTFGSSYPSNRRALVPFLL